MAVEKPNIVLILLVVNWMSCGFLAAAVGGTALEGGIVDGEFLIRWHPGSHATVVTEGQWLASLVYTASTVSLTPLLMSIALSVARPRAIRGRVALAILAASLVWLFGIGRVALLRYHEYMLR